MQMEQQQARVREQAEDLSRERSELQRLQQAHTRLELALADANAGAAASSAAGRAAPPGGGSPRGGAAPRRRSGGPRTPPHPSVRGAPATAPAVPAVAASRSPCGRATLAATAAQVHNGAAQPLVRSLCHACRATGILCA